MPADEVWPSSRSRDWSCLRPRWKRLPETAAAPSPAPSSAASSESIAEPAATPAALAALLLVPSRRSRSARLIRTFPFPSTRALVRGGLSAAALAAVLPALNARRPPATIERPQETAPWRMASRLRRSPAMQTTKNAPTADERARAAIAQMPEPVSRPEAGRAE